MTSKEEMKEINKVIVSKNTIKNHPKPEFHILDLEKQISSLVEFIRNANSLSY